MAFEWINLMSHLHESADSNYLHINVLHGCMQRKAAVFMPSAALKTLCTFVCCGSNSKCKECISGVVSPAAGSPDRHVANSSKHQIAIQLHRQVWLSRLQSFNTVTK